MFYSITGKIVFLDTQSVALETGGVAFRCSTTLTTLKQIGEKGRTATLYTHLNVREDALDLFGFASEQELECFKLLIGVSGVGPKVGIGVLSGMSLSSLALAIATSDVKTLSKLKGMGKKTAERIVLELREKISADGREEVASGGLPAQTETAVDEDAVIALMGLGFNRNESIAGIRAAYAAGATDIKDVLSYALRTMR